jgi:hypothetical protein
MVISEKTEKKLWLINQEFCPHIVSFQNPTTTALGRISNEPEEREKRKKCHLEWPPMFLPAAQGQQTDQN